MRRRLTDRQIALLKPAAARYALPDPGMAGLYVRVQPSGSRSFAVVTRNAAGKQVWTTLGPTAHCTVEQARDKARAAIQRIKSGLPAVEVPPDSFATVAGNWLVRHVAKNKLRTHHEIERCLSRYVLPYWQHRPFSEIKRRDVAALLDRIEDRHGARQADVVLTIIRSIATWYAARDDYYALPFVRGMARYANGGRDRVLDDDELRALWAAAEQGGPFGSLVQLALLTAQRLDKLVDMRWSDISSDGCWTVPVLERQKTAGGELVLPEIALAILHRQPRVFGSDQVFPAARGRGHMCPSEGKKKFTAALNTQRSAAKLPPLPRWTIHDLRRSARSLMSRAGVNPEHAERVLGHRMRGVQQIYDRHGYKDEKARALARLATLIATIVSGQTATVTPLRGRR
jgi:integrase